jgi:hypothetical protein
LKVACFSFDKKRGDFHFWLYESNNGKRVRIKKKVFVKIKSREKCGTNKKITTPISKFNYLNCNKIVSSWYNNDQM